MNNYIDKNGNYINVENLPLIDIYNRGAEEGYKKGYIDGSLHQIKSEDRSQGEKDEYNCFNCKYASKAAYEEPCNKCKHSYDNKFEWADMKGDGK